MTEYKNWLEEAKALYDEPDRHYHTWEHVLYCLNLLGGINKFLNKTEYLRLRCALVYHDAIYNTHLQNNEDRSAEVAKANLLAWGVGPDDLRNIARLIRLTKDHSPDDSDSVGKIMCDIDCAILGAQHTPDYRRYVDGVRKEYEWVDDDAWRKGRTAVLQSFLSRSRIFKTTHFQRLESAARHNLSQELKSLAATADCRVCGDSGLTYDTVERRLVPCGGIACTVLP